MKKLAAIMALLVAFTVFAVAVLQTPNTVLYFLNWGEYIDRTLVSAFEEKFHCQVVEEDVTSSEAMYQKITSQTTTYDVAIPGDYTVHQLYNQGYLEELDVTNSDYANLSQYQTVFSDSLSDIMKEYMVDDSGKEFNTYFMPYFWGAYSIIYSNEKSDVESVIETNGFEALYDRSLYKEDVRIGMYDTARWIVSSYLLSKGLNPNITSYQKDSDGQDITDGDLSDEVKNDIISALKKVRFDEFQNDSLKRDVANGSLDMCYTQLGDFFDALYLSYDDQGSEAAEINFSVNVPKTTAAFFDSMVIPTTCQNYDLANKFIDFMMDPDNAFQNARAIGYCPTIKKVCSLYEEAALNGEYYYGDKDSQNSLTLEEFLVKYPMYLDPLRDSENVYLLEPKSNDYLTTCETIFNNLA